MHQFFSHHPSTTIQYARYLNIINPRENVLFSADISYSDVSNQVYQTTSRLAEALDESKRDAIRLAFILGEKEMWFEQIYQQLKPSSGTGEYVINHPYDWRCKCTNFLFESLSFYSTKFTLSNTKAGIIAQEISRLAGYDTKYIFNAVQRFMHLFNHTPKLAVFYGHFLERNDFDDLYEFIKENQSLDTH